MKLSLQNLLKKLNSVKDSGLDIIDWATPVPVFGDMANSTVASLGLNPSNREFVDIDGSELRGNKRRFHTLSSLGIDSWQKIEDQHIEMIEETYRLYFQNNPYDGWFKALDNLLVGLDASYYGSKVNSACHLDLIPFATHQKWTNLKSNQKHALLALSRSHLIEALHNTSISLLILNGKSVVEAFQNMTNINLSKIEMPNWSLPRSKQNNIKGYAYEGALLEITGVKFGRKIRVIGFNHNIQSSFGVTNEVKRAIRDWISIYR